MTFENLSILFQKTVHIFAKYLSGLLNSGQIKNMIASYNKEKCRNMWVNLYRAINLITNFYDAWS